MQSSTVLLNRSRCSLHHRQCIAFHDQASSRRTVAACSKHDEQSVLRRVLPSIAAAAAILLASSPTGAEEIYAAGPSQYAFPAAERYATQQEARFDEYLQTNELKELMALLQKGSFRMPDLEAARLKVGFQRGPDGRVSLKGQEGHWYSIKNDMQSPGFILVRDQQDGRVLFLPPDESGRLMQIDLSDDVVVGQLFGSGAWQDVMEQLQAEDFQGKVVPLVLSEQEFRNTASLLEDAVEQEQ